MGVDKARIAEHVTAVQNLVGRGVQLRAYGPDDAVFAKQIHAAKYVSAAVAADQRVDIPDQERGHKTPPLSYSVLLRIIAYKALAVKDRLRGGAQIWWLTKLRFMIEYAGNMQAKQR
jgi:hypothetical protein